MQHIRMGPVTSSDPDLVQNELCRFLDIIGSKRPKFFSPPARGLRRLGLRPSPKNHISTITGSPRPWPEPTVTTRCSTQRVEPHVQKLPPWLGADDLFGFMGLGWGSHCTGASVGIMNAALVHEERFPSH